MNNFKTAKSYESYGIPLANFTMQMRNPIPQLKEAVQEAVGKAMSQVMKKNPLSSMGWDMMLRAMKSRGYNWIYLGIIWHFCEVFWMKNKLKIVKLLVLFLYALCKIED